ncbi:hypothetical protein ACIQ6V_15570 [Streptomyces sp. NPDC096198]|uniref:hypothetical protein n=1 Tax=Streptomyces sp. NPDC096198 TaxID=3366080 RepID=UPI0037F66716
MLSYPSWGTRQKVTAADLNLCNTNSNILANRPFMRASGISTMDGIQNETTLKWDSLDSGGFTTTDMKAFRAPVAGVYWVTSAATMTTPSSMTGYNSAGLTIITGFDTTGFLKGMIGSKIKDSYHTAATSGLVFLKQGSTLWSSATGTGGAWRTAATGNPATSISYLSAVLLYPDAGLL